MSIRKCNSPFLLIVIILFLTATLPSWAAPESCHDLLVLDPATQAICPKVKCDKLGSTRMSADQAGLVACLANTPKMSASISCGKPGFPNGACSWKYILTNTETSHSLLQGWPDIIICTVYLTTSQDSYAYYISSATRGKRVIYELPGGGFSVQFNQDGSLLYDSRGFVFQPSSNTVVKGSTCSGRTVPDLITEGKAFNYDGSIPVWKGGVEAFVYSK